MYATAHNPAHTTNNQLKDCLLENIQYLGWDLMANTAHGFALYCICNLTPPLMLYYPHITVYVGIYSTVCMHTYLLVAVLTELF